MNYLQALRLIHRALKPSFYVEIGCRQGASLELAECPRLAIDPEAEIRTGLSWPTRIFRETSDAFFARPDVREILGRPPDMVFIDGMHLVEFALRDFMNIEGHSGSGTVIVIDDVAPGDMSWASRERETKAWTGDVYRLIPLLRHYRPNLDIEVFEARILNFEKGLTVISNLDPESTVLNEAYETIVSGLEHQAFVEKSAQAIRERLRVRPSQELKDHVATVANRRSSLPATHPLSERYLELLKAALINELYREDQYRLIYLQRCLAGEAKFDKAAYLDIEGSDPEGYAKFSEACHIGYPFQRNLSNIGFSYSMMGRKRMDSLHACLDIVRSGNVAGDLMECGVWRGGGCIFMAGYLKAHGMEGRRVLVADSFEGLPKPSHEKDAGLDLSKEEVPELAIAQETVEKNFALYDLRDGNVVFLKGWFKDTLPKAPVGQLALLRLDGDLYESTMDTLTVLYDKVTEGGIVIVDDFNALSVCEQAVRDFFAQRDEPMPEFNEIDWTGIWWIKSIPEMARG